MALEFDWEKNEGKIRELRKRLREMQDQKGVLMNALHTAQDFFGYIPIEIQEMISKELNIPLSEIYGVVTFYSHFSLVPKGKYTASLCMGTACYVRGAQDVMDELNELLGIEEGETSSDGKFSIEGTRCLGACGLAPVMVINDDVYGNLKKDEVKKIIDEYK